MPISAPFKTRFFQQLKNIFFLSLVLSSCIVPKNYQKNKPFITKNTIEVKGGNFTNDELIALKSRLYGQLEDSAKINVVDRYFIRHVYDKPPAFDTVYAARSAKNLLAPMVHLGYYRSTASYKVDTLKAGKQQRVHVLYTVEPGKPTLIDTFSYNINRPDLQNLAMNNKKGSLLQQDKPVTKGAVQGEISRLVDIYRNNGYYRFTSEELRMTGDTSLSVLTNINDDDPFAQVEALVQAQQKKDSPKIKLALVLNPPKDTNKLKQYYINNVYILPDYNPLTDSLSDPTLQERVTQKDKYIIRYHNKLFRTGFLTRNMALKKGDLYNQTNFYNTLNNFSKAGVWQSTNIDIVEVKEKDSVNKINLIIQLIPAKQFVREISIETSYSATSNTNSVTAANAGSLLGLSGNYTLTNRNLGKEGIKMTNGIRAGVEFNIKPDSSVTRSIINSNELTLSNSIVFPRFVFPFRALNKLTKKSDTTHRQKVFYQPESFISTNLSYINRINLFNLQSTNLAIGYSAYNKKNAQFILKLINIEFTKLYNETADFKATLDTVPFLRYSFNTALVAGTNFSYIYTRQNYRHNNRQHTFKIDFEESGFPLFVPLRSLNILTKYLRQYLKLDVKYTYSKSNPKSAFVLNVFGGIGIASKQDTTLPFFKQYYGGGSQSMRGWPIRGIGRGSQPLAPYGSNQFNDRTGDIQLEINPEYRFNIAQIIPNTLVLKGALFADIGNVWNLRNSKPGGGTDSAQFKLKNLWKETGIDLGTGLRFDFNYFVVRFDFGFRFKRPEMSYINDGWKVPSLGFNDVLQKMFAKGTNDEYRRWRYENFNFNIGINYPF